MPGEVTYDKHYLLLNFTCSIVSSILLKPIDVEPLIGLPMNEEGLIKPLIQNWCADHMENPVDVNIIHKFALKLAIKGTMIRFSLYCVILCKAETIAIYCGRNYSSYEH